MMEELLRIENLWVQYETASGRLRAVNDVSLSLKEREFVAVVGESGAGKSTLALAILGLLPTNGSIAGSIFYEGKNITELSRTEWEKFRGTEIGMIFQEPLSSLNPIENVGNQMSEALEVNKSRIGIKTQLYDYSPASKVMLGQRRLSLMRRVGWVRNPDVLEWLKKVRISDPESVVERYPFQLSGGMMQRVMIAMALSLRPSLLLADEPTTALDVTTQAQILKLMKGLVEDQNTAILLVTHDLGVAAQVADRIIVMYAGDVVEDGLVDDVFSNPLHPYTKALLRCYPRSAKAKERLETLGGVIPDLRQEIRGCKFAERCEYVKDSCRSEQVRLVEVEKNHYARCTLHY
jgi:peptide/nickel transport system ATP-binding protein